MQHITPSAHHALSLRTGLGGFHLLAVGASVSPHHTAVLEVFSSPGVKHPPRSQGAWAGPLAASCPDWSPGRGCGTLQSETQFCD